MLGFEYEHEAKRFLQEMQERLQAFGLTLHPGKTQLIRFGRHAISDRKHLGERKPETFDFLGFTHFCTQSKKNGAFVIGRQTIKKRMRATLHAIKSELRKRWHDPLPKTGEWIQKVLQGHMNYFSVSGNDSSIWLFFNEVRRLWLHRIKRRSQKGFMNWNRFMQITSRFFPRVRLLHHQLI